MNYLKSKWTQRDITNELLVQEPWGGTVFCRLKFVSLLFPAAKELLIENQEDARWYPLSNSRYSRSFKVKSRISQIITKWIIIWYTSKKKKKYLGHSKHACKISWKCDNNCKSYGPLKFGYICYFVFIYFQFCTFHL